MDDEDKAFRALMRLLNAFLVMLIILAVGITAAVIMEITR